MSHLSPLILDLAKILIMAGLTTLLFRKLRQPVVLGYILAGLLIGPQFSFFLGITDTASIKVWAEIGIIFLLFSLGLEFNWKKLATAGRSVVVTAIFEIIFMLTLGFLIGQLLHWSFMDSLFLGGIISISSTTIIVSSLNELKMKKERFAQLVFGIIVIEDILAVLILVLLSTVAITKDLSGTELILSSGRLLFFLVLWFLVGISFLPLFLKKMRPLMTDETTLIVALALCLLMVVVATQLGFSPALGAFVMGSLLSDTIEGRRVETLIIPIRNLFAAVFFVSVGMLIDLTVIKEFGFEIFVITVLLIYGKTLSVSVGAFLSGKNHKDSLQAGMSLSQIGEFSFIIATLGITLGVTSHFLYPVAVAVSAITTFTTPYMMKAAPTVALFIERNLPGTTLTHIRHFHMTLNKETQERLEHQYIKSFSLKLFFNLVVVAGIFEIVYRVMKYGKFMSNLSVIVPAVAASILISAPFMWAILFGKPKVVLERVINPLLKIFLLIVRVSVAGGLFAFLIIRFPAITAPVGLTSLAFVLIGLILGHRSFESIYTKLESHFLDHLQTTENHS